MAYFCALQTNLSPEIILFNGYKGPYPEMVNTIILIVKYYVYVQRCLKEKLNFLGVIKSIEKYKKIEEIAAKKLGKLGKHNRKWSI